MVYLLKLSKIFVRDGGNITKYVSLARIISVVYSDVLHST